MTYKDKSQQNTYQRIWLANRRRTWIQENGPCQKCGSNQSLEVDHIDPAKKELSTAGIWSRKESVRVAELAKCQVLCKKCHKIKSIKEQRKEDRHGTTTMYRKGCRCDNCKLAKANSR